MKRYIFRNKGFTLIEVMIAIVIIGISLLAIAPLLITSAKVNTNMSIRSRAQMLAAEKINELQTWTKDDIDNSGCADGSVCNEGVVETYNGVNISRSYRFNAFNANNVEKSPPYIITVEVSYTYRGITKRIAYTGAWLGQ